MKFLCDQCKAKYQIADEKVQGKTLRMKCRKCGHVIEIRAATEAAATGATVQLSALSDDAAAAVIAKSTPPPAAPSPAAKSISPRPVTGAGSPPRANIPMRTPTPRPQTGLGGLGGTRPPGKPSEAPKSSGALASAFNKQVTSPQPHIEASPESSSGSGPDVPAEEWYVAIDDVPVGPIRLTELRAKYAQGLARDESLVWREGYEEWRPLGSLPDLHRVVREEVSGANLPARGGSLLPSNAPNRSTSTRSSGPAGPARPSPRPAAVSPAPAARGGNVIPFVQPRGGAAARKLDEEQLDDEATQIASSPFANLPKPEPAPVSGTAAKVVDDPFAAPRPAPFAPAASSVSAAPIAPLAATTVPPEHSGRGTSKGVIALIAAAALLVGVVIAVFAIKPKIVEKVVEKRVDVPVSVFVPTPGQPAPAETTTAAADPTATTAKVAVKSGGGGGAAAPAATPSVGAPSKKLGGNDMGPDGPPVPGANTGPGTGGGGASLDGKAVEGVVASKRVGVRKVCYEPWADKGSASVKVTLKIGADGRVQSSDIATSSGEPAIGQCVQRLSKSWTFPPSEGGGTFNVPFLFGT